MFYILTSLDLNLILKIYKHHPSVDDVSSINFQFYYSLDPVLIKINNLLENPSAELYVPWAISLIFTKRPNREASLSLYALIWLICREPNELLREFTIYNPKRIVSEFSLIRLL